MEKFDKYLGIPARIGRSKVEVFNYLKDRLWSQVSGWNEKNFSMAGREVLIKSVLQAIPTFVMSCFKLPDYILDEAEKDNKEVLVGFKNFEGDLAALLVSSMPSESRRRYGVPGHGVF